MKMKFEFSPNYSSKVRLKKDIKFVIIHYTGMQSEIESIKRLKNKQSKVSCHYLINRKGVILQLVKDVNIAWHAGKSKWKTYKNLNKNSIGIELVNKGHQFGYQSFSKAQIRNLIKLGKKIKKKYGIKKENFLGHSDIAPIRKQDPGEKFPWKKLSHSKIGKWYNTSRLPKNVKKLTKKKRELVFFRNLHFLGYRYFDVNKRSSKDKKIVKSFQQHYLPKNVTGKIDQKTLEISNFLAKYT